MTPVLNIMAGCLQQMVFMKPIIDGFILTHFVARSFMVLRITSQSSVFYFFHLCRVAWWIISQIRGYSTAIGISETTLGLAITGLPIGLQISLLAADRCCQLPLGDDFWPWFYGSRLFWRGVERLHLRNRARNMVVF